MLRDENYALAEFWRMTGKGGGGNCGARRSRGRRASPNSLGFLYDCQVQMPLQARQATPGSS
jgi:hypothetical protein